MLVTAIESGLVIVINPKVNDLYKELTIDTHYEAIVRRKVVKDLPSSRC